MAILILAIIGLTTIAYIILFAQKVKKLKGRGSKKTLRSVIINRGIITAILASTYLYLCYKLIS